MNKNLNTEERIQKLESQLRYTRIGLFSIVGLLGLFLIMGFTNAIQIHDVVQAYKFELLDKQTGKVIAQLRPGNISNKTRCGVMESINLYGNKTWYAGTSNSNGSGRFDIFMSNGQPIQVYDGNEFNAYNRGYSAPLVHQVGDEVSNYTWTNNSGWSGIIIGQDMQARKYRVRITDVEINGGYATQLTPNRCSGHETIGYEDIGKEIWIDIYCIE